MSGLILGNYIIQMSGLEWGLLICGYGIIHSGIALCKALWPLGLFSGQTPWSSDSLNIPSLAPRALNSWVGWRIYRAPFCSLACLVWFLWHMKSCVSFSSSPSPQPSTFCSLSCYQGSCKTFPQHMASWSSKGAGAGTIFIFWQKFM